MKHKKTIHATRYTIRDRGFTLIEFLVVLSIIVFIVPSLFGLIYSLLRQQSRIIALQEVKRQGDLVYNHMKVAIKNNAIATYSDIAGTTEICTTASPTVTGATGAPMYFLDVEGVNTYFGYSMNGSGTGLDYKRTSASDIPLTNSSVTIGNLVL